LPWQRLSYQLFLGTDISIRRVHKYAHIYGNASSDGAGGSEASRLPASPLALSKDRERDQELNGGPNSTIRTVIATANFTSIPQDLTRFLLGTKKFLPPRQKSTSALLANCTDPDPRDGKLGLALSLARFKIRLPCLGGPITPNTTLESLDVIEAELGPLLRPGGAFEPENCNAQHHVAIVVPFRDRYAHLLLFLRNIHPFLMKQRIAYRIFIVEQTNGKPFNRAAMMNIGYLEALKLYQWDCFIFHDVDLLPLDDRNLYNCPRQPRHMSVAIDTLNFRQVEQRDNNYQW